MENEFITVEDIHYRAFQCGLFSTIRGGNGFRKGNVCYGFAVTSSIQT